MFPNTHSWYHSMSARSEEAVSRRCQYPCWPCSLPPKPLHTWHWRIVPPEQRSGGFLWRTSNQTFPLQWGEWPAGSISTHFKLFSVLEQSWTSTLQWGIWWCSLFLALWHFKRVSSIISFVSVHVAWQIKHSGQRWSDWKTHGFYCLHKLYPRKKTGQISLYSLQELSVTKSPLKPSKDVLLGGNVHWFKMIFKPLKPPKITQNK